MQGYNSLIVCIVGKAPYSHHRAENPCVAHDCVNKRVYKRAYSGAYMPAYEYVYIRDTLTLLDQPRQLDRSGKFPPSISNSTC